MERGRVEPNISMEYPRAEDGWQHKRKPQSNPSTPRCLGKIFSRYGLSVGGEADETIPASTLLDVTALCPSRPRTRRATRLRLVSVFRQGWVTLLVALLRQEPLPQGRFVPEPWPAVPTGVEEAPEPPLALPKAA